MARKSERKGLGRGLSALLAETGGDETAAPPVDQTSGKEASVLPIESITANPNQPRQDFAEHDLEELSASISRSGIIQPLIVRPDPNSTGKYQIVAGERRWRAAQRARLHEVPVVVREFSDDELLEVAIIENVQRVDLNPIEEALGYRQLMDRFGHSQSQIAEALGKSRSHIANLLRLLNLPDRLLQYVRSGEISAGHARALLTADQPETLAARIIRDGLSVRQTEALAKTRPKKIQQKQNAKSEKDADTRAIEGELSAQLGCAVQIDHAPGQDGGHLKIRYRTLDDLDRLLGILSGN